MRWVVGVVMAVGLWACPAEVPPGGGALDATVPGNSCESAMSFELPDDGGLVSFSGDATGFADHTQCIRLRSANTGEGPDVIYRFRAERPLALEARIDGGTLHVGDVSCVTDCDSALLITRLSKPFNREHLTVSLEAGEHSLFAEAAGPYGFDVRTHPLAPGDRCDDPLVAAADAGPFAVDGNLAGYFDEDFPAAPLHSTFITRSADLFVALPAAGHSGVRTRLSGTDAGLPRLTLLAKCGDKFPLWDGRQDFVIGPGTSVLRAWTETSDQDVRSLPFHLELEVVPLEPGDRCEAPFPLAFTADGGVEVATLTGDTASWFPTRFATCGDGFSGDVYAEFTLSAPRNLAAVVSTSTAGFLPVLGLRAGACSTREAMCESAAIVGAGASLTAAALPAGRYVLTLGSANRVNGAFALTVTLSP